VLSVGSKVKANPWADERQAGARALFLNVSFFARAIERGCPGVGVRRRKMGRSSHPIRTEGALGRRATAGQSALRADLMYEI
jgi:hypothetical protein